MRSNVWRLDPPYAEAGSERGIFLPVFESDTHGYNTRDYRKIDVRLGTNEDFKEVCDALHRAGIRVVLDGVFNHVGRGFAQFQDVILQPGEFTVCELVLPDRLRWQFQLQRRTLV